MRDSADVRKDDGVDAPSARGKGFALGALILLASSSMLFHESASWALGFGEVFGASVNLRAYSCNAHSLGLVFGYAITQVSAARLKSCALDLRFWIVFYFVQCASVILFYGILDGVWPSSGIVVIQFVGAASGATIFVVCAQIVGRFDPWEFLLAVMAVLAGTTIVVQGLFGVLETSVPLAVSELLHVAMVAASGACMLGALRKGSCFRAVYEKRDFLPIRSEERHPMPCWRLFAIVGAYACVFGFMHVVPLAVPLGVFSRVVTFLLGVAAALALFVWTVRAKDAVDVSHIWNRFYRFVFPVVVVAALLGPLTVGSEFLPALVMQSWALFYFDALLATASYAVCRAIDAAPSQVFARAFLIRSVGFLVGNLIGMAVHEGFALGMFEMCIIATFEFVLLAAVTFNMNSERYAKTVWGLLPHQDPRGKFDRQLLDRCSAMVRECGLTEREAEVLAMLARGKRPKEVGEELVVSVATVRSHVQAIYSKTGVHSHDELMRLIGGR